MSGLALDPLSPLKAPVPNAAEILANRTYEALMWALARPGTVQTLPSDDLAVIAETLVDRECRVSAGDSALAARISAMGAEIVDAAHADHAFLALDTSAGLAALSEVPTGSHLYPDDGATVFASATIGSGRRLRLLGPGIETVWEIALGGLLDEVWSIRASRCLYPTGFELFLIDGNKVIGIPRSTTIEVL